jgi:hypothetical protein
MKQFINDHFAVMVVVFVFSLLFTAYMLEVHWGGKVAGTVDWLEGEMKEVIGAILMGLTGSKAVQLVNGQRATDKPTEQPK